MRSIAAAAPALGVRLQDLQAIDPLEIPHPGNWVQLAATQAVDPPGVHRIQPALGLGLGGGAIEPAKTVWQEFGLSRLTSWRRFGRNVVYRPQAIPAAAIFLNHQDLGGFGHQQPPIPQLLNPPMNQRRANF